MGHRRRCSSVWPIHPCLLSFDISVNFESAYLQCEMHASVCAFSVQMLVCVCLCVCASGCRMCALLWRTGKEEGEANLFLCRLTLSFQTSLFTKTSTISSVYLLLPPSFITLSTSFLIAWVYCPSLCDSLSIKLTAWAAEFVWESDESVELNEAVEASQRAVPVMSVHSLRFQSFFYLRRGGVRDTLSGQEKHGVLLALVAERKGVHFSLYSLSSWVRQRFTLVQLTKLPASSCLLCV